MASRPWGTLIWEDPSARCGDAESVVSLVEESISATRREPIFVRAEIEQGRVGRLRASILLRRRGNWTSRDVDAANCSELRRATSVVVAMAYEMGLGDDDAGPEDSPFHADTVERSDVRDPGSAEAHASSESPTTPASANQPVTRETSTSAMARGRTAFATWAAAAADVGTLPTPAAGARLRAGIEQRLWSVAITGLVLPAVSHALANRIEGASIGAAGAGVQACARLPLAGDASAWELNACGAAAYGRYWASGFGMSDSRSTGAHYVTVELALYGTFSITPGLRLRGGVEGALHTNRPTFVVSGAGDVHRPSAVALRLALGPEVSF